MGININSLFSGFGSSGDSGFGSANWLSDYRSIKNGSYGKLMKAYYNESNSSSVKGSSGAKKTNTSNVVDQILAEKKKVKVESKESKAYTSVKNATDKLMSSVEKLRATDESSVFEKKNITTIDENGLEMTEFGYDKEAIYNAVNDFVQSYNSVLSTSGTVSSSSVANRVADMQNITKSNQQALSQMGITVNTDGTFSINKDNFMKADMQNVENVLGDKGFFTYGVSEAADMIKYNANYEQLRAATYTEDGSFNSAYNVGSSYNSSL